MGLSEDNLGHQGLLGVVPRGSELHEKVQPILLLQPLPYEDPGAVVLVIADLAFALDLSATWAVE
jgi:hypothetical protein